MAAALDGLDVLVFTGGVGEHAPAVRSCAAPAFLGATLDKPGNQAATGDADISAPGARVATVVVTAREDLEVARQVRAVLSHSGPSTRDHDLGVKRFAPIS
jgi:acetate kinase